MNIRQPTGKNWRMPKPRYRISIWKQELLDEASKWEEG